MKIFTLNSETHLSKSISRLLDVSNTLIIEKFEDGEFLPKYTESVRGKDIFLLSQSTSSDNIISTCLSIDAAKRAGANKITLILPYMPYSRQDKLGDHLRSSIGSKMIADIFEKVGISQIISIDLHTDSIPGFFNCPFIHLNGNKIFIDYIKSLNLENICLTSPDQGAIKKNINFAKSFNDTTFAVINKRRIKPNEIHSMELIGDVSNKNVIIVDDLIDTGGTLKKASILLKENGALSIRAIATHGVLSGKAIENIESSELTELIISDTIEINQKSSKINIISCAELLSKSINGLSMNYPTTKDRCVSSD